MRNRRPSTQLATALAVLLAASASCGGEEELAGPGPGATTQVSVVDNAFQPSGYTLPVGQRVTWTWRGSNEHSVTFDNTAIGASETQSSGSFSRTFQNGGQFTYYCSVHGRAVMSGSVTVSTTADPGGYP